MKINLQRIYFLISLILFSNTTFSTACASNDFFTVTNTASEYLTEDENKITILEYFDNTPPQILFSNKFEGYTCTINKIKCLPSSLYTLSLKGLKNFKAPKKFNIEFTKKNVKKRFLVQLLPDDLSAFKVDGQSKLNTNIIFSRTPLDKTQNIKPTSELFNLKPNGEIFFYRKLPFAVVDFRPHLVDGKLYYTYLRSEASFVAATIMGKRELLDERLTYIKTFPELCDMHEFILLGLNWYIGTRYSPAITPLGKDYINQEVIEVKDGKEIYNWSIYDLYKQFFIPVGIVTAQFFDIKNTAHQFHLNGIQILSQDELLISLAYDGIIIIDKTSKKIKFVLGGANDQFSLTPEQKLVFLHTPFFDVKNNKLTVFHNDLNGKPYKILEYDIDREFKKINKFKVIASSKMISLKMGSVEKNENTYSINIGYTRNIGPSFIEQTDNKIDMKITFNSLDAFIYRTYRASLL